MSRNSQLCSRANRNSESRGVNESTLPSFRGFPYRDIATRGAKNLTFQTPSPEVSIFRYNATWTPVASGVLRCHVTFGISRIVNPRCKFSLMSETPNAKPRFSDSSESHTTCPCRNRRLRLTRGIATHDFNEYETLTSSNVERRYVMALDSFLRLQVKPRAASPGSDDQRDFADFSQQGHPVDSSSSRDPSTSTFSLLEPSSSVCSRSVTRELSLLSLIPLTPLETFMHASCARLSTTL
jgi:hypothetical protein